MIAYHGCYDLNYFAWIHIDMMGDARWIAWRTAIVAQFLFLVGVSQALRAAAAPDGARINLRRWAQIAACAALVSASSAYLFGARWIWFGVLHYVALAQLLLAPLARREAASWALGIGALIVGCNVQLPLFAPDALSWIGFSPVKPATEDFVPLLPWSGVVLLGIAAALGWQRSQGALAQRLRGPLRAAWRAPALLGRWPLTVYMLHQPILFGLLALAGHR